MANLTVLTSSRAGVDLTGAAAAGGGDAFLNSGKEVVVIRNGDSNPVTVNFVIQKTVDGVATATGKQVTVPAGKVYEAGPFPKDTYDDQNQKVQITYSGVTSLNVAVVKRA